MESVQSALNITDNSINVGFWFTVLRTLRDVIHK